MRDPNERVRLDRYNPSKIDKEKEKITENTKVDRANSIGDSFRLGGG